MNRVVALLLILASTAQAGLGLFPRTGSLKAMKFDPSFPKDLRAGCTFNAPLINNDNAECRGNCTPTRSGGVCTSATLYLPGASGLLEPCPQSGGCYVGGQGVWALGAVSNSLLWSNAFTATTSWTAVGLADTAGPAIVAPDGTSSTVYVITEDAKTSAHSYAQAYTSTSAKSQTVSLYVKRSSVRTWAVLEVNDTLDGYVRKSFDLATGVVGTTAVGGSASHWWASSSSITLEPLGYYRCVLVTGTATGTAKTAKVYIASADNTISYEGASASLFIWGASVTDNATFQAPGVLVTEASAGSRSADGLTYPVAGNTPPPGAGTAQITATLRAALTNGHALDTVSVLNKEGILMGNTSVVAQPGGYVADASGFTVAITAPAALRVLGSTPTAMCIAASFNDSESYINGSSAGKDVDCSMPSTHTRLSVGSSWAGQLSKTVLFVGRLQSIDISRLSRP